MSERDTQTVTMSSSFYLRRFLGGFGTATVVGFVGAAFMRFENLYVHSIVFQILAIVAVLYAVFYGALFWFRAWQVIQDGHAHTSPGLAVGLLFVPGFNLYWAFPVFWGFAKEFNAFARRGGAEGERLSEGLFLALAISTALSLYGIIWPIAVVAIALFSTVITTVCSAVNDLGIAVEEA